MRAHHCLVMAILLATVVAGHTQDLGKKRLYECQRTAQAPVIDGKLNDACWQKANASGEFWLLKGGPNMQQTLLQAVYDEGKLYLGITCLEKSPERIIAQVKVDDLSSVMGDDALEIFLQPDLQGTDYYQLSANSIGTKYDAIGFNPGWGADWQAAGSVGKDAWYLECAISFKSSGQYGVPGATWGFNVCRDRNGEGDTEWSCWSPSQGGFHQPAKFGRLIFGGEAGSGDRATLIECARAAQRSIDLEAQLNDALKTVKSADLKKLEPKQQKAIAGQVKAAEEALQSLQAVLGSSNMLDTRAWLKANEAMQSALDGIDEAAWAIKFEKLFEDQD